MARTAKITLDGTEFTVHAFNIGELERITQANNNAWIVLKIAMERAEPRVADPSKLEPTQEEVAAAFRTIMDLAGFKLEEAGGPTAAAEPQAPAA